MTKVTEQSVWFLHISSTILVMSEHSIDQAIDLLLSIGYDYGMIPVEDALLYWHDGGEVFVTLIYMDGTPVAVPFTDSDQQDSFVEDLLPSLSGCTFMDYRFCRWDVFGLEENEHGLHLLEEYFSVQHGAWRLYDDAVQYVEVDVDKQQEVSCYVQAMD